MGSRVAISPSHRLSLSAFLIATRHREVDVPFNIYYSYGLSNKHYSQFKLQNQAPNPILLFGLSGD